MILKAAVTGLGRMGAEPSVRLEGKAPKGWLPISHAEAVSSVAGVVLAGLCDSDTEKLKRLGEHYQVSSLFTGYKEMIDTVKPDILCIATRTEGRTNIIRYACENGVKIIYAEKPLARSIADCIDVLSVVKQHKVILGYGVNRRYHKTYREAKKILASGRLGEIREIVIEHGRSNLYWAHPHSVDLILFFAGTTDIESIQGNCSFINAYLPTDNNFIDNDPIVENAFFTFKNGISASINQTGGLNTRIACTEGILTIHCDGTSIEIRTGENGYFTNSEEIIIHPEQSATQTAFMELVSAHQMDTELPVSNEEIAAGMIMLNGIVFSSLNQGIRISSSEVPVEMIITGRSGNFYA